MEAWYAHSRGKPVVVYTGGTPPHPWTVYVAHGMPRGPRHCRSSTGPAV